MCVSTLLLIFITFSRSALGLDRLQIKKMKQQEPDSIQLNVMFVQAVITQGYFSNKPPPLLNNKGSEVTLWSGRERWS